MDGVRTDELDYDLPPELIAQQPAERRDESRLLVYSRATGEVRHARFRELPDELPRGTLTVVNDTRVVPARIPIERPRGEVLLLERLGGDEWEGLARPTRRLRAGGRYGPVELARAPRRGPLAAAAHGRAGRRGAAAAVHHRAARRPGAVPDGVRARSRARPPRRRRACTSRRRCSRGSTSSASPSTSASTRSGRSRRTTVEEHEIHGERYEVRAGRVGADPRRRARARGRHDDGARARDAGARALRSPAAPSSSSRRASSSAASTAC